MIKIENLSKTYNSTNNTKKALTNINLVFEDTGLVFLTGKSGSGKSTLLNMLGAIDYFDEGVIEIDDITLNSLSNSKLDEFRNTYLGFVFQDFNIFEEFTVRDNILLASRLLNLEDDEDKLDEILKSLDLFELKNRYPSQLSGGQRQRVAIARGLIKDAKIFLLDEPTGNLDSENSTNIFKILKEISKTHLVIVVSHDEEYVNEFADRVIKLVDGQVASDLYRFNKEKSNVVIDDIFEI